MKTIVMIPAYNEAQNIEKVVRKLKAVCPETEYLIINDCSEDNTEQICKENKFNYITLPVNLGIGGGVQAGYQYALKNGYDIAVQFDGDGQHNAEYIENLIKPLLDQEADMVIGSRFISNEGFQTSSMRRMGIRILKVVIGLCTGQKITDATSGFRAVNRKLIVFFAAHYAQDYPEPEAIVTAVRKGFKVKEIPVVMNERAAGVSSINVIKSVYYMIKVTLAIIVTRLSGKECI